MTQQCELVQREETPSIVVRTRCNVKELPHIVGPAYQKIAQYLGSQQLFPSGPPYVGYHNEDLTDLEIEIGFPIEHSLQGEGEFESSVIPAGRYASTVHVGPYSEFARAYNLLTSWTEAQSLQVSGSCYEIYLNDPADTAQAELQTIILFPLISGTDLSNA